MGENSRGPRGETDTPERDIDLPASTASESETVDDEHVAMTGDVGNAANATTSHNDISTDCSMSTELTLVEESQKLLQNIHKSDVNVDAGLHVATGDDAVEMDMEDPKRTVHGRDHGIPPNYNLRRNGRRRLLSRQNVLKLTYANVRFKKFSGEETPGSHFPRWKRS